MYFYQSENVVVFFFFNPCYLKCKSNFRFKFKVESSSLENSEKELILSLTFCTLKTFGHDLPV